MDSQQLKDIAQAMVAKGKGILAIDESHGTCTKRFAALGVDCTEASRRDYRGLLVTAPDIENYVSGMIMYDETLRQATDEGVSYPDVLKAKGMIPGIKVDTGSKDLALHPGEQVTEGLDGLRARLEEYAKLGAQFAKWRAVIRIGDKMPSKACVKGNSHALARYAALVQEAGMVPMVEPEVLLEGNHSIETCYHVTAEVIQTLFAELKEQGVLLEGTILKISMVLSGKEAANRADVQEVAEMTVKCLTENVPAEVAGVVFLSGGQTPDEATAHLNAMNKIGGMPWPLSFSYGRAIQEPTLNAWATNPSAREEAQTLLVHRAHMNSLATLGEYNKESETAHA